MEALSRRAPKKHPDLFWAIRGGRRNFGIVTSFLYQAHPVSQVIGGPMFWDLSDARDVLESFGDHPQVLPRIYTGSSRS